MLKKLPDHNVHSDRDKRGMLPWIRPENIVTLVYTLTLILWRYILNGIYLIFVAHKERIVNDTAIRDCNDITTLLVSFPFPVLRKQLHGLASVWEQSPFVPPF